MWAVSQSSAGLTVAGVTSEVPDSPTPSTAARAESGGPVGEEVASESVTRNAAFAFGTKMTTAAISGGLTIFLGRTLDPTGYGYYALALAIAGAAAFLADLGITASTPRFLAERRGDRRAAAAVFGDSLRLKLMASVPVCTALFALAGPITEAFNAPEAAWALRGISIALLAQGLLLLVVGALEAVGRIAINFRIVLAESLLEATAILTLVLLGAGAAGAAFGRAIGYAAGAALALAFAWRVLGSLRSRGAAVSGVGVRDIARYAGALLVIDGLFRLFAELDVLLISALIGGGAAVGLFELPMMLAWFLHYPVGGIATAVAPRLARRGDQPPQVEMFGTALRYTLAFQGIFVAPIVVWAEPIVVTVLGSDYRESAEVLRALAPFVLLSGPAILVSLGVNYMGEARRRVPLAITVLLVNAAVDVVLIPRIGIVGGAIGTDVAYMIWVPAHILIIRSLLDLPLRPLAVAFIRSVVAAAVASVPLLLLGTGVTNAAVILLGGALSCLVYLAALYVTREIKRSDIDLVRGLLKHRLGRSGA